MSKNCELCGRDTLQAVYEPERSTRGLKIHLCDHCGLLQSLPRIDRAPRAAMAVSSGADWGNVRYGKGFRTKAAIDALIRHTDLAQEFSILDAGSNRGSFARALLNAAPHAELVALEPDERVAGLCAGLPRTELISARIEDAALETGRFDIIHSCHTLEHLASPLAVLRDHWRTLKPGGLLVLDVPNVAIIESHDIVEEWFIDKHLTHFSVATLTAMVESAGFEIVQKPDPHDRENLLIVARRGTGSIPLVARNERETENARRLIAAYGAIRAQNIEALSAVAAEIAQLAPKRIAVWGAGRLFDSLVVHGGFDPQILTLLIDTHLKAHVGERFGVPVSGAEALKDANVGAIIVMSRSFAAEIEREARARAPRAEILFYSDLVAQARLRRAA